MPYVRAIVCNASPYMLVTNAATGRLKPYPATLPPSTANGCAFSPDGALLAVAHYGSPYVTIYNTSDWSKVADPATLPTSTANGCAFSPDGALLAVTHYNSPYVTIYNTSDWSKVADPATLPTYTANGCAFSPDGALLAVTHNYSPYITIYNTSDWSKVGDATPVSGNISAISFVAADALTIKGEVRDIDGLVASRKVRAYVRSSGDKCAETTSSAIDGTYELNVYEGNVEYDVQFMAAPLEDLNDLFYARTTGGTVP